MLKVLCVFGTRPEVIKMAPVIKELKKHVGKIKCRVCVSAQHRQMLDPFLKIFNIRSDYDLNIMQEKQSLEYITSTVLSQMGYVLEREKPDYVLVQGDTTTSMAAALAAYYHKIPIGHIEAGLRTHDKYRPFPEEINRIFIDDLSDLFFVHTKEAKNNLLAEGRSKSHIEVTGNTVIDALLQTAELKVNLKNTPLANISIGKKKIILITAHRRENLGVPLENICLAIKALAHKYRDSATFIYPVHLNPAVQQKAKKFLGNISNVFLIPPLDYVSFVQIMKHSYLILTDSGGIQEEAPSLQKPILVLRDVTERPEVLKAGASRLVGTNIKRIVEETTRLIEDPKEYKKMSNIRNPYGDGKASWRIVQRLLKEKK
jgi:UDP-N-acetylglucosamine 2-epimerase (non-hydrolysing)